MSDFNFIIKICIYKIDSGYILKTLNSENRIRSVSMYISVSSVVEVPGAGLSRLITINSELNGAI